MSHSTSEFTIDHVGDVTVVRLTAEMVDRLNLENFMQDLRELIDQERPRKMLLNLSTVEYFHSVALGRLIVLARVLEENGGEMRLCELQPMTYQVFVTTQLDRVFKVFTSQSAALSDWTTPADGGTQE